MGARERVAGRAIVTTNRWCGDCPGRIYELWTRVLGALNTRMEVVEVCLTCDMIEMKVNDDA